MTDAEIDNMAALEDEHWWYRGLRDLILETLRAGQLGAPAHPRVLDAGCGTGANLQAIEKALLPAYLAGFDLSERAVTLAQQRVRSGDIYQSDIRDPELHGRKFDVILSCDVVSISGIARSTDGLCRLTEHLAPGGLLILNLPALAWLGGPHDAVIGTRNRVTTTQVSRLIENLGLRPIVLSYRVFLPFPAIAAARMSASLRRGHRAPRSDLRRCPSWLNGMLTAMLVAENQAILRGIGFPWGSSVYAVARKR